MFNKIIGTKELVAYYLSSVVGVGILTIPSLAAKIAGPSSLLSWLFLFLLSIPFSYLFAQISIEYPDDRGLIGFIEVKIGKDIANLLTIFLIIAMIIGNPVMGITSAIYLANIIEIDKDNIALIGYGFMLFSIGMNLFGLKNSARLQIYILFFLIISLVLLIFISLPHLNFNYLLPFTPNGWASIGKATLICFFSFLGLENVSTIAKSIKTPHVTFKKAIPIAIFLISFLYIGISFIYILITNDYSNSTILFEILNKVFNYRIMQCGSVIALIILVFSTNAWVLGASKIVQGFCYSNQIIKDNNSIRIRYRYYQYSLIFLSIAYGIVMYVFKSSNFAQEKMIFIVNANFITLYIITFFVILYNTRFFLCKILSIICLFFISILLFFLDTIVLILVISIIFLILIKLIINNMRKI